MSKALLSVCIPNYNHGHYLPAAIDAILSQSLQPDEIIILDDASTDDSVHVIEQICRKHPRIQFLRNQVNQGCCRTVNQGVEQAQGKYVACPAADDLYLPGYFEKITSCMERHPQAGAGFTRIKYIDTAGETINSSDLLNYHSHEKHAGIRAPIFLGPSDITKQFRRRPWFISGGPSALYRRDVVLEAGGWHPELGPVTDWFNMYFAGLKHGLTYIPEPLVAYRIVPDSFGEAAYRSSTGSIELFARVLSLMQSEYFRGVFPEDFIHEARQYFAYAAFRSELVFSRRQLLSSLRRLAPAKSFVDKILLRYLGILLLGERLALRTYCRNNSADIFMAASGPRQADTRLEQDSAHSR